MENSILPVEILIVIARHTKRVGRAGLFFSCRRMNAEIAQEFTGPDGRPRIATARQVEYKRICYSAEYKTTRSTKKLDILMAACRLGSTRGFYRVNYSLVIPQYPQTCSEPRAYKSFSPMRIAYKHNNVEAIRELVRANKKQNARSHFPLVAYLHGATDAYREFLLRHKNIDTRHQYIDPADYCEFILSGGDPKFAIGCLPIRADDNKYKYSLAVMSPEVYEKLHESRYSYEFVRKILRYAIRGNIEGKVLALLRWLFARENARNCIFEYLDCRMLGHTTLAQIITREDVLGFRPRVYNHAKLFAHALAVWENDGGAEQLTLWAIDAFRKKDEIVADIVYNTWDIVVGHPEFLKLEYRERCDFWWNIDRIGIGTSYQITCLIRTIASEDKDPDLIQKIHARLVPEESRRIRGWSLCGMKRFVDRVRNFLTAEQLENFRLACEASGRQKI